MQELAALVIIGAIVQCYSLVVIFIMGRRIKAMEKEWRAFEAGMDAESPASKPLMILKRRPH